MHVEEIVPFDRRQPRSLKCVSAILDRKQIYNWPTILSITLYVYLDQRPISLHTNQAHTVSIYSLDPEEPAIDPARARSEIRSTRLRSDINLFLKKWRES